MGKKKSKAALAAAAAASEDALLDAAVAEVETTRKQLAEAQIKNEQEQAQQAGRPTRNQLLMSLDESCVLYNLVANVNGVTQPCTSPNGELVWYFDAADAKAAMEERQLTHHGTVALGCTPLGRALGVTEGWVSSRVELPATRLQASQAELRACGDHARTLCPPALRRKMNQRTSPIPVVSLEEWQNDAMVPFFLTRGDMIAYWRKTSGKEADELPASMVLLDLRVLVYRMLTVASDWARLKLVPSRQSVQLLQGHVKAQTELAANAAADATAREAAVQADDEPPPLVADEPPELE